VFNEHSVDINVDVVKSSIYSASDIAQEYKREKVLLDGVLELDNTVPL